MLKIAHLILTHKQPQQLERLIRALDHPAFDFYIHVDRKADEAPFRYLARQQNVFFIRNRVKIFWAGYGTIQATLNGFREILPGNYDYINVISGQDFPIKPASYIYEYISRRKGTEFITCETIDEEWTEAAPRIQRYHLVNWRIPGKYRLEKLLNWLLPRRRFPLDYRMVGRANWFTLTQAAVKYLLAFETNHREVVRYFWYCWGADEFFFATILYNSSFQQQIARNLVYVEWLPGKGHPEILTKNRVEALKASDQLFARKVDMEKDAEILDLLENWILDAKHGPLV